MKNSLYWLGGLGFASVLVLGTTVRDIHADGKKSPLRGTWSFSQLVPATSGFGTPSPIPTASAGTLIMDENNNFTGHAVLDTPLSLPNPTFELDFRGGVRFDRGTTKTA